MIAEEKNLSLSRSFSLSLLDTVTTTDNNPFFGTISCHSVPVLFRWSKNQCQATHWSEFSMRPKLHALKLLWYKKFCENLLRPKEEENGSKERENDSVKKSENKKKM